MGTIEGISCLFKDLKESIGEFYRKNADLDASGTIQMVAILTASDRLDLYLKGDFQALWRLEREEVMRLRAIRETESKSGEMHDVYSVDEDVGVIKRELTIMTRCVKKMTDNYRKECLEHEKTKLFYSAPGGKIDDINPLNHIID